MQGRRDTGKLSRNVAGRWVAEPSCNLTLYPSGLSLESHAGIFRRVQRRPAFWLYPRGLYIAPGGEGEFMALIYPFPRPVAMPKPEMHLSS